MNRKKPQNNHFRIPCNYESISWDCRPYLFGRKETNKIKNPSVDAHEDDVIPRAGAELERSATHGPRVDSAKSSKHDISKLPLMICDWRRLCTQENFFFFVLFFFSFVFLSSSDSVRLTRLAAVGHGFLLSVGGKRPDVDVERVV